MFQDFLRKRVGQLDGTELVEQFDAPDKAAADVAFAGDGAHDVLGRNMVEASDGQVVSQEPFLDAVGAFLAFAGSIPAFARHGITCVVVVPLTAFLGRVERREFREQRLLFLVHLDGGSRDVYGGDGLGACAVPFGGAFCNHAFHEFLELLQFAAADDALDFFLEGGDAFGADDFGGRQFHRFDGLAGRFLDGFQEPAFTRGDEQDGVAAAAGTSRTPDAVHVGFRVVGDVVVHHE